MWYHILVCLESRIPMGTAKSHGLKPKIAFLTSNTVFSDTLIIILLGIYYTPINSTYEIY